MKQLLSNGAARSFAVATAVGAAMCLTSCDNKTVGPNPFLQAFDGPYQLPPFEQIDYSHYEPAVRAGIEKKREEIRAIIVNRARPDFENTILALDNSGVDLDRVLGVWGCLSECLNTPEMQEVSETILPLVTAAEDELYMNDTLFQRIKAVYDDREVFGLDTAQSRLLDKYYRRFVRGGALLSPEDKDSLKAINQQLSDVQQAFGKNILAETNAIEVAVDNEADLAGLPEGTIAEAKAEAERRNKQGWIFTIHAPSRLAVLTNADNRDLRRRMYEAYTSLCSNDNEWNNEENINTILRLRQAKARLLGFNTFADYALDDVMAKTVKNAEDLLYAVWKPTLKRVEEEVADMEELLNEDMRKTQMEAHPGQAVTDQAWKIQPWDYYYYAEKVKAKRFNLSEDQLRPYFALDSVVKGIFYVANRLHGATFTPIADVPKYHPEVTTYDMKDADGNHLAVFMTDYFPRDTKRQGAWMSEFTSAGNNEGYSARPVVYNVCNLTKPTETTPSLLTIDEVQTVFHEFGHAMHGMFTQCAYRGQAGTSIDRDMVELPSQINEHWATQPEVLRVYARHYKTGEVIPDSLIEKMQAAARFNQGFMTAEYTAAAILDLELHKMEYTGHVDIKQFEAEVAKRISLPEQLTYRYRTPYFNHAIGSEHYAAGYYTYLWAEVLDTDAFELFLERGIFDAETARAYRENILEKGDSEDAMTLYTRFRGSKPNPAALLHHRGLQ